MLHLFSHLTSIRHTLSFLEAGRSLSHCYVVDAGLEPEQFIHLFPYWIVQEDITEIQIEVCKHLFSYSSILSFFISGLYMNIQPKMQENGCSGFMSHVMDVDSIFLLV